MLVRTILADALSTLKNRGQRSALALIGIAMGTASFVSMLCVGHMAEREADVIFRSIGLDTMIVRAYGEGGFNDAGIRRVQLQRVFVRELTPFASGQAKVSIGAIADHADILAVSPDMGRLSGLSASSGRLLSQGDRSNLVVLVGDNLRRRLSAPGAQLRPGSTLFVGPYGLKVIGILAPRQASGLDPTDFDNAAVVPIAIAGRLFAPHHVNGLLLKLKEHTNVAGAAASVSAILRTADPSVTINVQSAQQLVEPVRAQKAVQARFLAAAAGISLLVGGIGIMNVMLMGVLERRREIGLRTAVGASPQDVAAMFLAEAGMLAMVGGFIGVSLGVAISFVIAQTSHWAFSLDVLSLPLGAGLATLIGLLFGIYPAFKAGRLQPMDALRL